MNLSDVLSNVSDDAKVSTAVTGVTARLTREINRVCSEIWDGFHWSFRWRNIRIVTDTDVTAGTLTATNGSRTVTGAGTAFLSSHKNWHIVFTADPILNWYKVRAYTSSSQLELDVPYQGTTGGSKAYILRHFDYVLPTEIWDLEGVMATHDRRTIEIVQGHSMDILTPSPLYKGYPVAVSLYNSDSMPTTYTTGSVTGTINTRTLTGTATAWLDNIFPGDKITIGSYDYTIYSVDTNTQITLYNNLVVAAATASYTITRQMGRIMRMMWSSTDNFTVDLHYLRKYAPLVNNLDTNELLYRFPNTVALKVSGLELKSQGDKRGQALIAEAQAELNKARSEDDAMTVSTNAYPIYSYRSYGKRYREREIN